MLTIFRQMTEAHYNAFLATFETDMCLLDFLQKIFVAFRGGLFSKSVFKDEWSDMIMMKNMIMLQVLSQFSLIIRERFLEPFTEQLWSNSFQCMVAFTTQESLQLENFSETKQKRIRRRYDDMRLKMACEVRAMWNSLGSHKKKFVPHLVSALLEMSLIPVEELRRAIIPIFFDMMQSEFRLPKTSSYADPAELSAGRREMMEYRTIQVRIFFVEQTVFPFFSIMLLFYFFF